MTLTDEFVVVTTRAIADRLRIPQVTVCSWAMSWDGARGSGNRRRLTPIDALVARAWQVLHGNRGGGDYGNTVTPLRALAEKAIRAEPRRWLLLAEDHASTWVTAELAAWAWLESGQTTAQLIDLWSTP